MGQLQLRLLLLVIVLASLSFSLELRNKYVVPPATLKSAPYAEWAHYHWVWLSNDRANQSSMIEYAQEYIDHGIQVGAVDIDSGWSTGFNNFIFDTKKYPNASRMIEFFHERNISIILWATSMIDTDSSNFNEAHDKGYFIRNALGQQAIISWWHGKGGLLDYTNKEAVQWWHQQMDKVLALGIDGWKCDGTDPYLLELVVAKGQGGVVSRAEYSDDYYNDFFDYSRAKLGDNRLIMSRPVDGYGPLYLKYSPRHVMLSGWVGDQDPTFDGLENALKRYLQSAWSGYANFGSDIGGYRSGDGTLGRSKELLIRWAQLGAFSPLMENGGNKEHRPWSFDEETLSIYKNFVDIHYKLVPYLLSVGAAAYENGTSSISPLAKHENFIDKLIDKFQPDTYNYLLGHDILVAPVVSNPAKVTVSFPKNGSQQTQWIYWFNHSQIYNGGDKASFTIPLEEFTVFLKTGTIIPFRVTRNTHFYNEDLDGALHWWLYLPSTVFFSPSSSSSFAVREFKGTGVVGSWRVYKGCVEISITAHEHFRSVVEVEGLLSVESVWEVTPDEELTRMGTMDRGGRIRSGGWFISEVRPGEYYSILVFPSNKIQYGHKILICT